MSNENAKRMQSESAFGKSGYKVNQCKADFCAPYRNLKNSF